LPGCWWRLLVSDGQAVTVAIDNTLFHRRGPKVHAASWFHDGSATGAHKVGYGNNWVIAAIVVALPFLDRPLALPVGFALVHKGTDDSRLTLARRLVERLAAALPDRAIHVVADSAYAGRTLRTLPACITWTTRLHRLAPTRRPHQPLPRSWPRVLRQPDPARTPQDQPHPPTRSTRLHRHPHPSGVTTSPGDSSFSDQATGCAVTKVPFDPHLRPSRVGRASHTTWSRRRRPTEPSHCQVIEHRVTGPWSLPTRRASAMYCSP